MRGPEPANGDVMSGLPYIGGGGSPGIQQSKTLTRVSRRQARPQDKYEPGHGTREGVDTQRE